ncbi:hypothetical protein P8C59_005995 [Phyllachora maydis]|uniref:C2H2-type domain-containing protein n=1 Tax=Phyllachora maydis TaxID=1825666 RepID=A0AAD9I5I5_9PEZI|nr:hypothetical protein P8C59_005995 [Phyllachora maydis]
MWNETPLPMFETPTSPLQNMPNIKREQPVESPTYQAGTQRRRSRAVQDARRNSKALHRVQSGTGRPNAAARNGKRALRSTGSRSTGGHVKVAESAKFHCDAPGCLSGPYERNEHLKRHIKTKHSLDTPIHRCEAARCNAAFDRLDNLRQHLSLHDKERGGAARVKFAEGAAEQLERLQSQMKPRGGGARNKAARTARAA